DPETTSAQSLLPFDEIGNDNCALGAFRGITEPWGLQKVDLLVEDLRRATDQPDVVEERHELGARLAYPILIVLVVLRFAQRTLAIEPGVLVDVRVDHALDD